MILKKNSPKTDKGKIVGMSRSNAFQNMSGKVHALTSLGEMAPVNKLPKNVNQPMSSAIPKVALVKIQPTMDSSRQKPMINNATLLRL